MNSSEYTQEFLQAIKNAHEKYPDKLFYAFDGYFTLKDDHISFMPDEYGDGPKGGRGIPAFWGLDQEDALYLDGLLEKFGLDVSSLQDMLYEHLPYTEPSEIDAAEFEELAFEEGEEEFDEEDDDTEGEEYSPDFSNYKKLKKEVECRKTRFSTMNELLGHIYRYGLSPNEKYYPWEGGPICIAKNTRDFDEDPLEYASVEEWIDVLDSIDNFVVKKR